MQLKALTFDIIGTVFDAYDGLARTTRRRSTTPPTALAQITRFAKTRTPG